MPILAPAIATGLLGVGKAALGVGQTIKANKRGRLLNRPDYNIQDEYYQNRNLAADQAQGGLSDSSINFYKQNSERGLQAGIDAALQTGGNINNVSSLYDQYNNSLGAIAAKDDELQTDNIRYLIDRNKDLAGQKTMQWALNEYEPYKDEAKSISEQKAAGINNIFSGAQEVAGTMSNYATSKTYDEQLADYTNSPRQEPVAVTQGVTGANITPTTSTDWLNGAADPAKRAINDILKRYGTSPFAMGLPDFIKSTYSF